MEIMSNTNKKNLDNKDKVFDNINNKNSVPNKIINISHSCEHLKSFSLERLSKYAYKYNSSDYHCLCYLDDDVPDFILGRIAHELQKLGIEEMALLEGKPIFKTESGVVVFIKGITGFYQLLIPIKKPYIEHAAKLSRTAYRLSISPVFKSSLKSLL
jgi:hypothetical protein